MHTGSIIDFYDDPNGFVLKAKVGAEQVPTFIKTAQFLEGPRREQLPDDVYALVMVDQGAKFRKYACVDKGNTALSVVYFLENKDKLPEEAQKVAAANLLTACEWYDLQPPAPLLKTAGLLGAALNVAGIKDTMSQGIKRHKKAMGMPKVGDLTGSEIMPLSSDTEKTASDKAQIKAQVAKEVRDPRLYSNLRGMASFESKDKRVAAHKGLKKGDGSILSAMRAGFKREKTAGILQPDLPRARDVIKGRGPKKRAERAALRDKLRSTHPKGEPTLGDKAMEPYVDMTGKVAPPRFKKVAHQRFALVKEGQNRFPIDTYGDVLEADRWFNDHGESLHPEDRRELCVKLAARADEIGCKVTDYVKKYAGVGFAPDGEVRMAVSTRMQYFQDDSPERDMLNGLMNKYAHVTPEVFCEAVHQFDEATGLHHHWDEGIYDPWYTTYGFIKEAEWSFSTHGDKINEEQLKQVANASYPLIKEKFGDELANSLKKSPVSIFDSLPLDTRRIIMRMANDPQPSPVII